METQQMHKKAEWINLLMENGGSNSEFEGIKAISRTDLFALCKYKKILRSRGRGKLEFAEIEAAYSKNDIITLNTLLNKLFLEYFTKTEIDNFLELMKKTGTSIREVYNKHMESPEDTLLATLTL